MMIWKYLPYLLVALLFLLLRGVFIWWPTADHFIGVPKDIAVQANGRTYLFRNVTALTVGEFLTTERFVLGEKEFSFPTADTPLTPGTTIFLTQTHDVTILADGKRETVPVLATTVEDVLTEAHVTLDDDDIVEPARNIFAAEELVVTVTRVKIEEVSVEKSVAFSAKTGEDETLSWRKTIVTQKGEKGVDRLVYRVSSHDGKEVNRKLIRTERIKEPVTEIVTQGTYVKLGKSHTGGASWYAFTGTMAAANPWLPKGSYVKVTNLENGKSVIVVINDRGPFVPGRIIDLDKVAFAKIASVGAGVITVKMEEVAN